MEVMAMKASAGHPRDREDRRAAYTLMELVIVLLTVGILAAVAAPKYTESLASFRLEAVTHRIMGDIKFARRTAQENSATQVISFNTVANSYTLTGVTNIDSRSQTFTFSLSQSEYECRLVSSAFNGTAVLSFDVYGRPLYSGTVVVECGGTTKTITVNDAGQVSSL
jgi:Tfp pilus assembly protein FimT